MVVSVYVLMLFFVKQKTAYEMRICDWSSDVCSSDLPPDARLGARSQALFRDEILGAARRSRVPRYREGRDLQRFPGAGARAGRPCREGRAPARRAARFRIADAAARGPGRDLIGRRGGRDEQPRRRRSEEHTSERQSLMRISYAVFCLKKQIYTTPIQ